MKSQKMKREHIQHSSIVIPEPYVECPFTSNANDIKGHLSWSNAVNLTYSSDGAAFNGSSSYLRNRNQLKLEKIKTFSYLVKFNTIPIDGNSNTWHTAHYILCNNNSNYRYYSYLQHYSGEDVELTNCMTDGNGFSTAVNVLTTTFGSTVVGQWYRMTFRRNSNTTDVWIDLLHKTINRAVTNDNYYADIFFGKMENQNKRYLDGNIKDLRIWDVELTDEQITAL